MTTSLTVRKPQDHELVSAADVLASAFQQDPLFCHVVPHDQQRLRWLPVLQFEVLRRSQPWSHNRVVVDQSGALIGAMAVSPPGRYPPAWWRELRLTVRCALLPTPWCPQWTPLLQLRHYSSAFQRIHYPRPHWYLDVIGVHAAHQRRGVGRLLLEELLGWSQASGAPIWLETQTAANVGYYESHGFRVTEQLRPTPDGPLTWGMLHELRP